MDYDTLAREVLSLYPVSNADIEFIRHNENITYRVNDKLHDKIYILRIHKPSTEGLLGIQHTYEGLKSEIQILQGINVDNVIKVQKPVANCQGEYVTECSFNADPCYATLLEWIDGSPLTIQEDNIDEIAFALGENLGLFHEFSLQFKPEGDFTRPIYDLDRIDMAIDELKYGVEIELYSREHYEIIKEVLTLVKNQIKELESRGNAWGLIHADMQLGNIIMNNGKPCFIDFCLSGFGYYLFDVGSLATILPDSLRNTFLRGYSCRTSFSFDDLRYIEGMIFMDIFISYVFFIRDNNRNGWIKEHAADVCSTLCRDFLEGKEVFYSL